MATWGTKCKDSERTGVWTVGPYAASLQEGEQEGSRAEREHASWGLEGVRTLYSPWALWDLSAPGAPSKFPDAHNWLLQWWESIYYIDGHVHTGNEPRKKNVYINVDSGDWASWVDWEASRKLIGSVKPLELIEMLSISSGWLWGLLTP